MISVKNPVTNLQGILERDERHVKGRKTQEEVYGMETVKQMTIQKPMLLPKNQQHESADPEPSQSMSFGRTELIYSMTSPSVPNTGLYTRLALSKRANN